jgi:hypothetical protein
VPLLSSARPSSSTSPPSAGSTLPSTARAPPPTTPAKIPTSGGPYHTSPLSSTTDTPPSTVATCKKHAVPIRHAARQVLPKDFTTFTHILASDAANLKNLLQVSRAGMTPRAHAR